MTTRLLVDDDRQKMLEYIKRNSIETSFLYANVIEFGVENRRDMRRCADYFGFFVGDDLKGILPFYNLGSCIPHFESEAAIAPFIEIMKERTFGFLLGMEKIVRPLYQELKNHKSIAEYNESSYFINRAFRPYRIEGLEFVNPRDTINDQVIDFVILVKNDGFHENADHVSVENMLNSAATEEDAVITVKDGKMVAYASIQTYTDSINQIGSVYTVTGERGKGYCKAVVSELCSKIIARGKIPTLFVKKSNVPAVKAYTAIGFEHFDDYLFIKLS